MKEIRRRATSIQWGVLSRARGDRGGWKWRKMVRLSLGLISQWDETSLGSLKILSSIGNYWRTEGAIRWTQSIVYCFEQLRFVRVIDSSTRPRQMGSMYTCYRLMQLNWRLKRKKSKNLTHKRASYRLQESRYVQFMCLIIASFC